jgi:putative endonuclease
MFHVYVLRSEKTGRRYVGSCEDLSARVDRHNSGKVRATKHGSPWRLLHSETLSTHNEAVRRELYYKTGRGRDALDQLETKIACRGDSA